MSARRPGSRHYAALNRRRWRRVRREVLARDQYTCRRCGKRSGWMEVHHVVALEDGGAAYDPSNLESLCRGCHIAEHARPVPAEVREWREFLNRQTLRSGGGMLP